MPGASKLNTEQRMYVVQALACFDTPSQVAEAVKAKFGIDFSRQAVETCDPTKAAGKRLDEKWRLLFHATREAFLKSQMDIGISHRSVRLRALERMTAKAESMGNLQLAGQFLEQAAKECGDLYTTRRQLTGAGSKPLFSARSIDGNMSLQEAQDAYVATLENEG